MTTEQTEQLFAYIGARTSVGTLFYGLLPIETVEAVASEEYARWFKPKKQIKALVVGGVYSAKASATGITLEFKRVGRYSDEDQIVSWRVLDDAAEVAERMAKLEKDERTADTIGEAIEPIRAAYQKTDTRGKRAIEALVLAALRKGS